MPIHHSRRFFFLLFGSLYFVQGVIAAYSLNFFKPHMSSVGIEADRIALVAALSLLPFIIKILYGLISDRIDLFGFGHRVPYMVLGIVLCSLSFLAAFFVVNMIDPAANFWILASMVIFATFAMALFDTTADAYAVEVTPPEDHSRVQSVMASGRASGLIVLSAIFGLLAARFGYAVIYLTIAIVLLFPLFLLAKVREPRSRPPEQKFDWRAFALFLKPSYLLFGLFLTLAWFAFQGIDGLVTFYMSIELGAPETTLGAYGTLKGIGMVGGAISMSVIAANFGLRWAALGTLVLVSLGGLSFSVSADANTVLLIALLWGIVVGLQWTVYATMAMGITDLRIAASMFALFQMMTNIGIGAGEGIATALSDNFGFSTVFQGLSIFNLFLIPLFFLVATKLANARAAVLAERMAIE